MTGYDKKRRHERHIKNKERDNAQSKAYRERHKEEIKAWKRKHRKENQEEIQKKQREWVEKNREHVRKYMREYYRNRRNSELAFRERLAKNVRASYEKHRDEAKARRMVRDAIASGRIRRQPCEVCGTEPTQAHHDDYNYPLKVRWLCSVCHAEWHRNNQPIRKEIKNETQEPEDR